MAVKARLERPRFGRRRLELRPEELRRHLDPGRLHFASTAEVEPLVGTIGQPRALAALEYGLAVETRGFNLFLSGPPGSGRLTTVLDYLRVLAVAKPAPSDWIYVYDFGNPDRPNAIPMPAGRGVEFAKAMDEFVDSARREIPRAFESEEYDRRQREIVAEIARQRQSEEDALTRFAAERMIALKTTLVGVASVPLVDGEPISRERFEELPAAERAAISKASTEVEERAAGFIRQVHQLDKEAARRVQELEREVALYATEPLFRELEERYGDQPEVLA
jgi:hypothetical protein